MLVHRCRFVEWTPATVVALAFNHSTTRLAVARENGNIEIWDVQGKWRVEKVLRSSSKSHLRTIVWTKDGRLLSGGLDGMIVQWNLHTQQEEISISSDGGAVWSMALNHASTTLAVATEDGAIRLFDVSQPSEIVYSRSFDKQKGRALSVAWSLDDQFIVSGSFDGTIRKWSATSSRALFSIKMEKTNNKKPIVWCVALTRDDTIVSGNSHGFTQIWDGQLGTLIRSFHSHSADVLTIAVDMSQDAFFTTGTDNKVVMFQGVPLEQQVGGKTLLDWQCSCHRRTHSHDLRALALSDGWLVSECVHRVT
eukprot:c8649_g1_i2.p1 GENE.c8649_g1_i2~~c8649_g1_i2.p1  ORF type:complete len:321 (-),score=53.35 c8649_g1_i2:1307-2230(-)